MLLAQRVHLFPFRTQKLSSAEPKILAWRRAGKIGHCRHNMQGNMGAQTGTPSVFPLYITSSSFSSLAQSVEHLTVNQGVTGSSPVGGAKAKGPRNARSFCFAFSSGPGPVPLSCNSRQSVGRLTCTLTFPQSGMRSFRPQDKVAFRPLAGETVNSRVSLVQVQ